MKIMKLLTASLFLLFFAGCLGVGSGMEAGRSVTAADHVMRFHPSPEESPVIFSGTADTPTFPMDACAMKDEEGYHLFYSSVLLSAA